MKRSWPLPRPATFYAIEGGNDLYWRVEAPCEAVGGRLNVVPEKGGLYAFTMPNTDTAFRWAMAKDGEPTYFDQEGAAVFTRPDGVRAQHMGHMRSQGTRVVTEVDDNYVSNPKLNIFLRVNRMGKKERDIHLKALLCGDAIVYSTEWLRDRYYPVFRKDFGFKKRDLPEFYVCHNNVAEKDWPERVERTGPARIGWMGSPSHVWDVDLAWPAMLHAKNIGCETWMIGFDPAADTATNFTSDGQTIATKKKLGTSPTFGVTAPRMATPMEGDGGPRKITVMGSFNQSERSLHKQQQWAKVGHRHIPWQPPKKHHRFSLPLDIGLCPLLRNDHTLGKSDVKFIEYTISGAATIASNNEVYNRSIIHGETGLLVGSPQEMLEAVGLLVRDENLRSRLVANAQEYVRKERGERQLREEWGAAIGAETDLLRVESGKEPIHVGSGA